MFKKTKLYKVYKNIIEINKIKDDIEELKRNLDEFNTSIKEVKDLSEKNNKLNSEIYYANVFHDSIKNSEWLNITLSLSSRAIGYPFAYILFKTLDVIKPKKILELGLGQSTKIITEYVNHFDNISHDIVEHNQEWT